MIRRCLVTLALLAIPAAAEPPKDTQPPKAASPKAAEAPKPPRIEGMFGFDVMKPKQKCAKVAGALLAKLNKSYDCGLPENGGQTGSGVSFLARCTVKKGPASEYMLFSTAADCNTERETQLANAE